MDDEDTGSPPLSRPLRIVDIDEVVDHRIEATSAEMAEMATLLGLVTLDGFKFDYRLRRGAAGRVHLKGRLQAHIAQTCVVTLEPIESHVDIPVEVEFWPARMVEELEAEPEDPGQSSRIDWPEAIAEGMIDLGPVIYDSLATGLDLYPKRADGKLEWSQAAEDAEAINSGPFAALKKLKMP
jgi:uncharacterized metal-binding protein YceD (DUF177 family)